MLERALLVKVARVISTSLNLRPVRTTVDVFGTMSHFISQTRRSKLDFKFEGTHSKRITAALQFEFPKSAIVVHEARVPILMPGKTVTAPYLTGSLIGPTVNTPNENVTVYFSVDPIGTLTVRQLQANVRMEHLEHTAPGNLK